MFSKNLLVVSCNFLELMVLLYITVIKARIAQLVEQWIEDPRVTSSNLVLGISFYKLRLKNFIRFSSKLNLILPIGPFLCFAIINSISLNELG